MEGPNLDLFAKILAEAKSRVNASNGKMYFVYLPSWARYAKFPLLGKDNVLLLEIKLRERILSIANSLEIPIVDISQVFDVRTIRCPFFPSASQATTTRLATS